MVAMSGFFCCRREIIYKNMGKILKITGKKAMFFCKQHGRPHFSPNVNMRIAENHYYLKNLQYSQ